VVSVLKLKRQGKVSSWRIRPTTDLAVEPNKPDISVFAAKRLEFHII
jgi:hypothetical protein